MGRHAPFTIATQALTCNRRANCVTVNVTVAYPLKSVCALAALSVAEPLTMLKLTLTLFCLKKEFDEKLHM